MLTNSARSIACFISNVLVIIAVVVSVPVVRHLEYRVWMLGMCLLEAQVFVECRKGQVDGRAFECNSGAVLVAQTAPPSKQPLLTYLAAPERGLPSRESLILAWQSFVIGQESFCLLLPPLWRVLGE